jgi:hypothetical protein
MQQPLTMPLAATRRRLPAAVDARTAGALAAWAALVAIGWAWGEALHHQRGVDIFLDSPPLLGHWDLRLGTAVLLPVSVAGSFVWAGPPLARRASWGSLLAASFAGVVVWSVALALVDGPGGISGPLTNSHEYLTAVPLISSPGDFLTHFTERIGGYATHVRSHPPGMALIVWGLDAIGLRGSWPPSLLAIAGGASTAPAALIAMRELAGERAARAAAPFLVLAPAAIWIAVSADALYAGVGAWAVCLLVVAMHREGRRSDLLGLAGGVLFGALLFLSYGLALLAAIPVAVALATGRWRPLGPAAIGAAAVALVFLVAGFWWLDGFLATRREYLDSVAKNRPYDYFAVNNLSALALAVGPATAVALTRVRRSPALPLIGGAAAAILLADLTGMSKGEVERIWLPFMPWLLLAAASLGGRIGESRRWLCLQALCAIAIEVSVMTLW